MATKNIETIQRLLLDADKYKQEIKDVAKMERAMARQEKDVDFLRKRLDQTTEKLDKTTKQHTKSMTLAHTAGSLLASGIGRLTQALSEGVKTALDYEDWIGKDTAAIGRLRDATAGLISDLDLAKMQARLTTGDFKLQENQLKAVAKAAIHLTRINKTSFAQSLQQVTDVIKKGSAEALKELGFKMDLLGDATEKTDTALKVIVKRFGGMNIEAENTNERLSQMANAWESVVGNIGTAIMKSQTFLAFMKDLVAISKWMRDWVEGDDGTKIDFFEKPGTPLVAMADGKLAIPDPLLQRRGMMSRTRPKDPSTAKSKAIDRGGAGAVGRAREKRGGARFPAPTPTPGREVGGSEWEALKRVEEIQAMDPEVIAQEMLDERNLERQQQTDKKIDGLKRTVDALDRAIAKHKEYNDLQAISIGITRDLAERGFGSLTSAIMSSTLAAIDGTASFAQALGQRVKATAFGIAIEAALNAGMAWGRYFLSWGMDASALAAAKTYTATAVAAGSFAAGTAIAIPGGGGGGGSRSSGAAADRQQGSYRPEFGRSERADKQPINVNLYIGNKGDLGARAFLRREFEAELKRAQAA